MRLEVPLGTMTYLLASSPWINAVDHWILGGATDTSKNRCLPCICSSNNEDSESDIVGQSGEILLYIHSIEVRKMGLKTCEIALTYHMDVAQTGTNTSWPVFMHVSPMITDRSDLFEVRQYCTTPKRGKRPHMLIRILPGYRCINSNINQTTPFHLQTHWRPMTMWLPFWCQNLSNICQLSSTMMVCPLFKYRHAALRLLSDLFEQLHIVRSCNVLHAI